MCILLRARGECHLQKVLVVKDFRHHLEKFFMITPANLFLFSTSVTCVQMQSDLYDQSLWLRELKSAQTGDTQACKLIFFFKIKGTHVESH